MAYVTVTDYIDVGTGSGFSAATIETYKDEEKTILIERKKIYKNSLGEFHTALPKIPEDGKGFYKDLDMVYARIKIHIGKYESSWFDLEPKSQNYQKVIITEEGKDDIITDSTTIDMQ